LVLVVASGARAKGIVTLVCSGTPDGPPSFQIQINFDQSTVNHKGAAHRARISDNQITWETPRFEARGEVRYAARYTLDRIAGTLHFQPQCLPRDSFCGSGATDHCKPGRKLF